MKHLLYCMTAFFFLGALPAYADGMSEIPIDSRIKILTYSASDVFTVPTKYGYQTSIVFAHNEEIKTISVGDRSMWQIIPSANRIFIRPMDDDLATNMTIITSMREYTFDIKSVKAEQTSNLYVIQFRYPDGKPKTNETLDDGEMPAYHVPANPVPSAKKYGALVTIPPMDTQRAQELNENYSYNGPDDLAPMQVYDDGKNTYVMYNVIPKPTPKPMFMGASGKFAMARHKVSGNKITINTIGRGFELQSPKGKITVYNELFNQ